MRIALCGAHGVGKSSIAKILGEQLNLPILNDIVVDAHKLGFTINENTPIETQIRLTGKQIEQEKINQKFIADKCIFDYYVYAEALNMDTDMTQTIKKAALKTHNYDHVFYIKPEFPIEDDGLRSTNPKFQADVHDTYEKFLINYDIKYNYLTGSIEERIEQIIKVIK